MSTDTGCYPTNEVSMETGASVIGLNLIDEAHTSQGIRTTQGKSMQLYFFFGLDGLTTGRKHKERSSQIPLFTHVH